MRLAQTFIGFDGEVNSWGQGTPSIFIRFAGCNLSCVYCDTKQYQTFQSGIKISTNEVFNIIKDLEKRYLSEARVKKVTITGGEPLLQFFEFWKLVTLLDNDEWEISVETNGSMPIINSFVAKDVGVDCWIVDYKLPSSGMTEFMMPFEFFDILSHRDFIKFVIQNEEDFLFAKNIQKYIQDGTACKARFAYSPCWGKYDIQQLVTDLLNSESEILGNCIINYQLHKLWLDPSPGIPTKKN